MRKTRSLQAPFRKKQINGVFLELTPSQQEQLGHFLNHYIVAED